MDTSKDQYFVAVKVFLKDGMGRLLITKDRFGDWDIPGGRLRENDFEMPLEEVVRRKMKEELGEDINYQLGKPDIFMRHQRDEILETGNREKRRIFAIGYEAEYLGGDISLGNNHEKYEWVDLEKFVPEDYFIGGWLAGVKEYQAKNRED
jgi:8-oxo-dGTP pyrophosphatase MutT (NUDIX family)